MVLLYLQQLLKNWIKNIKIKKLMFLNDEILIKNLTKKQTFERSLLYAKIQKILMIT